MAEPQQARDAAAKPGIVDRLKARYQVLRERFPLVDHLARTLEYYSETKAGTLSGAVTYFGLLSFFPIMALVFAVLGFVVTRYAEARQPVLDAIQSVLPGLFDQIDVEQISQAARTASIIGVLGLLYAGLGWLSALRGALQTVFAVPKGLRGNFVIGKVTDLIVLFTLGGVLLVSVASTSLVTTLTGDLIDSLGLEDVLGMTLLIRATGLVIGILASSLLFYVIFRLLGRPKLPARALWEGAALAAVGFEVLKLVATLIIGSTLDNPIYGPFALVIALLVWINYFARITLVGASWAATTPPADQVVSARLTLEAERALVERAPELLAQPVASSAPVKRRRRRVTLLIGAALGAAAVGLVNWLDKVVGRGRA